MTSSSESERTSSGERVLGRPAQRRQQAVVLGDVVGAGSEKFLQLDDGSVGLLDVDAVTSRTRIAARSAVDVRRGRAAADVCKERRLVTPRPRVT